MVKDRLQARVSVARSCSTTLEVSTDDMCSMASNDDTNLRDGSHLNRWGPVQRLDWLGGNHEKIVKKHTTTADL
jgi:hypothetical protein